MVPMFFNCNLIQNSLSKIVLKNFCMIFVIISIKLYLLNLISNLFNALQFYFLNEGKSRGGNSTHND